MKYDAIIIGGGIAGVTAAIYLKRARKNVLLFEEKQIGGQIVEANIVENYPTYTEIKGYELGKALNDQLNNLDIPIVNEKVLSIDGEDDNFIINTSDNKYECKKVIIATGSSSKTLGLPNEHEYLGKGLSFCATCDGNFFKNKDVAVIGGGNVALDDVIYLSNIANKVYLIHRRDTFRGASSKVDRIKELNNVEMILNANVKELKGNGMIESIDVDQEGNIINLPVSGVFVAVGHMANSSVFTGEKNESGNIIVNETFETNIPGIYSIGDVINKEIRQLTTAASDGTIAAMNILKKL